MTDPMPIRRRYTRKQKLSAVMAAEAGGLTVTAEELAIPKSTLKYWLDDPKYAPFRTKAREDLAEEVKVAAHLLWRRVVETAHEMEPRDALFGAEKASTILQLLSGGATSRAETKDITETLDDHERAALRDILSGILAEPVSADTD